MTVGLPPGLPDAGERERAVTDFETNLVVLAGAGTGKTELLVERALTAMGAGVLEVGRLAAVTFTEKAAGEMRERLALGLERLLGLARGKVEADRARAADRAFLYLTEERGIPRASLLDRSLAGLTQLDRASVSTIHSFCSDLLRANPRESGVNPDFAVDPGQQFRALFEDEWERFLAAELGPGAGRPELWTSLLSRYREAELREAAMELSGFGVSDSLLRSPDRTGDARTVFGAEAARIVATIDSILERQSGMTPVQLSYFHAARTLLKAFERDGLVAFQDKVRRDPGLWERITIGAKRPSRLSGVGPDEFDETARQSRRLVRDLLKVDDRLTGELLAALAPFVGSMRERHLRSGYVSFDALLSLARDLLRDHPDVRDRWKRRYGMILLDEFQDTDPVQYEIVLFLAERPGGRARSAYEAELESGRLFIVGDPKQSIYRFRGADYTAFRRAVGRVLEAGGSQLLLRSNFRSVRGILESVNCLFGDGGGRNWMESNYQPPYVGIEATRGAAPGNPAVEVWTVDVQPGARAAERRKAEGRVLAREIRRRVDEERTFRHGDITVLLRSFTSLAYYLRPLRAAGIPFLVDGGREFRKRPEVAELLSVLRALVHPSDAVALLAFLRSPAGGVADTELAAYAADGGGFSWRSEVARDRFPMIAAAFERLRTLAFETRDLPPDALIRHVVSKTDLLALSGVAFEGPQRVANLRKLQAAAADLARDGRLSLGEVLDALEAGRLSEIDSDSPMADEGADAVRVMTIHKAKGLENRLIFVADLAREDRQGRDGQAVRVAGLAGSPALALKVGGRTNAARAWSEREEEEHERAEEIRVLYVALTRAKDRIVVLSGRSRSRRKPAWAEALHAWGYDPAAPPPDGALLLEGRVLHRLVEPPAAEKVPVDAIPSAFDTAVEAYGRAVEALRAASSAEFAVPSSLGEGSEIGPTGHALSRGGAVARAAGTVVHRLLRGWRGGGDPFLASLEPFVRAAAAAEHVREADVASEVKEIAEAFLGSPLAARLREIEAHGREVPLVLHKDGTTWWGSVDLLYTDAEGRFVVVDFKTDRDSDDQAVAERYRKQVGIYREAVMRALKLPAPPRAELWMIRQGRIVKA